MYVWVSFRWGCLVFLLLLRDDVFCFGWFWNWEEDCGGWLDICDVGWDWGMVDGFVLLVVWDWFVVFGFGLFELLGEVLVVDLIFFEEWSREGFMSVGLGGIRWELGSERLG